jgi:MFS family permease
VDGTIKRTFAAFEIRNFRLFYLGQGISMCGTWMQAVGLSWLVLRLTHSGTQLGLVLAAQFLPVLLLGVWGGVIADRFDKRHILYVTQTLAGLLALILGLLVVTHTIQLWMIYALAAALGLVSVADNPTRQSFVIEMVGEEHVKNAVTLNSTLVNTARVIGPSVAGVLIATVGIGPCFIVNAASYIAVLMALYLMRQSELHTGPTATREPGQIRAGLEYAWSVPKIRSTLIMMFIIGTFAYEFPVVLPLFATKTLHGNAGTYSAMTAAMGIGAIIGGIYTAGRAKTRDTQLMWTAVIFGISIILAAVSPTFLVAIGLMIVVGVLSVIFIALGNTTLQLTSEPQMRGRVMALWSIAFLGTTPIGGPIIGYISDNLTPRIGLAAGGISAIIAGVLALWVFKRQNVAEHTHGAKVTS